jgi:hypothetical protein
MKPTFFIAALCAVVLGCSRDATAPTITSVHSFAIAANDASADGVVRGFIRGMQLTNPQDSTSYERVADVRLDVFLEFTHLPADSSATPPLHQLLGSLTSDASGAFELTNVPGGYYSLDITPPATSPYASAKSGTVAFSAHSVDSTVVWLTPK